jgi:phytoene dehydrogenase-like protein
MAQVKVTIAGGGIAGMTAALRLAERGCQVTLYEVKDVLGGNLASGLRFQLPQALAFGPSTKPEFDVYPHMYQAWYVNFWQLLEDAGVQINWKGDELEEVDGFVPFKSFYQLRKRTDLRPPNEQALPKLTRLTDPYSAGHMLENLASGVAPPADMFTMGYASIDLQAEAVQRTVRLRNMSLTGYLNSRRYLSQAAIDAYETFITTVWGMPAYLISADDYRAYAAYCYGAAEQDSWLTNAPAAQAFIGKLEEALEKAKVKIKRQLRVAEVMCERGAADEPSRVTAIQVQQTEYDKTSEEWLPNEKVKSKNVRVENLVLAIPPKPLAAVVRAAGPGKRITDSLPQLRELARVESERMPMLHLVFKGELKDHGQKLPGDPVSLAGSKLMLAFTDISQTQTQQGASPGNTVLAVSCSEPSMLPSVAASQKDRDENARAIVAELKEYLAFEDGDVDWDATRYRENRDVQLSLNAIGTDTWRPCAHFAAVENLFFAGDFCRNDFGITTVEAAVATGLMAANAVVKERELGDEREVKIKKPVMPPLEEFLAMRYLWLPAAYAARAVSKASEYAAGAPGTTGAAGGRGRDIEILRYLLTPGLRPEDPPPPV